MEIIVREDGREVRFKGEGQVGAAQGERTGVAYRLKDGRIVYVPEAASAASPALAGAPEKGAQPSQLRGGSPDGLPCWPAWHVCAGAGGGRVWPRPPAPPRATTCCGSRARSRPVPARPCCKRKPRHKACA